MRNDSLPPSNKSRDSTKKIVGILSFLIVYKQSTLFLEKQMVASDFVFLRKRKQVRLWASVYSSLRLMIDVCNQIIASSGDQQFFFCFSLSLSWKNLLHDIIRRRIACMLQLSANCTVYYMIWSPYITIIIQVILLVFFWGEVYLGPVWIT